MSIRALTTCPKRMREISRRQARACWVAVAIARRPVNFPEGATSESMSAVSTQRKFRQRSWKCRTNVRRVSSLSWEGVASLWSRREANVSTSHGA